VPQKSEADREAPLGRDETPAPWNEPESPIAVSKPATVTAKQGIRTGCALAERPADEPLEAFDRARWGEMKRDTSSVVSIAKSDDASDARSSRSNDPAGRAASAALLPVGADHRFGG